MTTPKLTESIIRAGAGEKSFQRGRELYHNHAISNTRIQGNSLSGDCEGTESPFYQVRVELDSGGIRSAECSCPYEFGGYCKHTVALLLAYLHAPEKFVARKKPAELLSDLNRDQLLALLTRLLDERRDLRDWVEASIDAPSISRKGEAKTTRRKIDTSVYRRRVRSIMHSLDHMRASEAYWHVGSLANELRGVQKTAMEFLDANEPEAALDILLTLLEESHDGFEYIDDSNGELGDFLSGLGEALAEVILSLDLEEGREDIISNLEDLHEKLSDYGIDGLEVAIAAARCGWGETDEETYRPEQEDYEDEWEDEDDEGFEASNDFSCEPPGYFAASLTRVKLNILDRKGRIDDYLALCLKSGAHLRYSMKLCEMDRVKESVSHALKHLTDSREALELAQRLREMGHIEEAIRIGERGLKLDGHKTALGEWLGPLEEAQGRASQALEAWLAAFCASPRLETYKTVKRLAGSRWNKLKPEVFAAMEKCYSKQPLAEVLLFEEEWDEAIKVADKNAEDYRLVGTVADALIDHRPQWVIRVSIRQAEKLIEPTKSKLYPIAADWLRRAKAAYASLGQKDEWQRCLQKFKDEYKRRPALQEQLKRL
ncbi:MAG: SWIM zinc finger family protein [Acidobacteriota bacterium]